ncbi:unnamed protein product [Cuscuta epithymum]|uniref:Chloroplast lumen common family protein n=1 Tax=Cuscuta epithymum TaxID=186058 RepID=A0AAV0E670_9ASTE|nr:unnamed protein product [Cuscuta epithymum]CAH9145355.1 unnamed protein product [Cuscuta epithymum]
MNTITNISAKPNLKLPLSSGHRHSTLSRPVSSLSFTTPPSLDSSTSVKASSYPLPPSSSPQTPKSNLFSSLNPRTERDGTPTESAFQFPFSILKGTVVTTVTAAALLFGRFWVQLKPVIASPAPTTAAMESAGLSEEKEKVLEEKLLSNPNDVEALRNLMEIKIQNQKIVEAIGIIERLIELDPSDAEWPLLKSHLHTYTGELEMAKKGFNEILSKDPLRVEAYHGLVMAASKFDSIEDLKEIEKRIEEVMVLFQKENKRAELRDFKLLIAQIRVIEGKREEALEVYKELVKEDPRDFRPYLCQGIIYMLLSQNDEAEKNFEKYRKLVPKGHPYASYFDESMIATKGFAQGVENAEAVSIN